MPTVCCWPWGVFSSWLASRNLGTARSSYLVSVGPVVATMRSWRDTLVRRRASQSLLWQALVIRQGRRSWATSRSRHNMSASSKSLHGISSALICTTDSTVLQPPITLLIQAHYHHRFAKFALQPWSAPQTNVRLGRWFVNAASHECRPFWMTSQW